MNFKDRENILVIICSSMGIAALALIFRYLFIEEWGFDSFGANLVFIIIFVVSLVLFISYLEVIQKIIPPLLKRRKQAIENQDTIPESDAVEDIEPIMESEPEEAIVNEVPLINELDLIRERHSIEKQQRKEQLLETAIQYTQKTFAPYTSDENIAIICQAVTDYFNGLEVRVVKSVTIKDLSNGDLFHFGWNIWNHFRINKQEDIALFLKIVFARNLKDVDTDTIRKKLTFDDGKFKIVKIHTLIN